MTLKGGEGRDTLKGGVDNDKLEGGAGIDNLTAARMTTRLMAVMATTFSMAATALTRCRWQAGLGCPHTRPFGDPAAHHRKHWARTAQMAQQRSRPSTGRLSNYTVVETIH